MVVAQEEIFGPVVTVIPFEDEQDAVRIANDVKYGLMATVWTGDPGRGHRLARAIKAGMVGINMPYTAFPGIPFGGYKQSGFGREMGHRDARALPRDEERAVLHGHAPIQPVRAVAPSRYRWAVLGAGTAAQASFSAIGIGLPVIAPALRDEFGLSLTEIGVALAAEWIGLTFTLLPWGFVADRIGERRALAIGLAACGALMCAAAFAPGFWWLVALVALAGAAGGSVQSASGRAVIGWFDEHERGLALGVRQTAVPLGGLVAALTLPAAVAAGGVELALLLLGAFCLAGALVGGARPP